MGGGRGLRDVLCVAVQRMGPGSWAEMSKYGQGDKERGVRGWEGQA